MARPKGSVARSKTRLVSLLRQQYGEDFHPIMRMAKHAVELDRLIEESPQEAAENGVSRMDAINAWDKVAAYTEPKLKALEITAEVSDGRDKSDAIRDVESILARRSSGLPEPSDRSELH